MSNISLIIVRFDSSMTRNIDSKRKTLNWNLTLFSKFQDLLSLWLHIKGKWQANRCDVMKSQKTLHNIAEKWRKNNKYHDY